MPPMRPTFWLIGAVIGLTMGMASGCAGSQYPQGPVPQPPQSSTEDPPGRVGRVSYIDGPVSFLAASADSWSVAEPNRPVSTSDRLWADNSARAEIDVGSATVRLASQSEVDVVRLDDHWLQLRVPQGTVSERMRVLPPDQDDEIDTPNAALTMTRPGEYRVTVSPDGQTTTVTVWSGEVEVTAAGSTFPVQARQVATIRGDNSLTYDLTDAGSPDDFDRWALDRDARADRANASLRYVSEDMPGVEDLDPYGRWDSDANYGPIWYPTTVEAGWAPYRQGHWVWVSRWGWTWVDEAPWGFAPYHYGRWAFVGSRWGWCPGRVIARPVYAPALVAFVGGPSWQVTAAFGPGGGVAWFPLAPEEVYYPAYATDIDYRRRINVTNVTNVTIINNVTNVNVTNVNYRNRGVAGAVTAVPTRVFVGAQPVRHAVVEVPARELATARVVGPAAPLAPTTASFGGGAPGRRAPLPPPALATRVAVASHTPPPAPVPFAIQQRQLETTAGRPLTRTELSTLRPAVGPGSAGPPVRSAAVARPGERTLTPARPTISVTPKPATFVPRAPGAAPAAATGPAPRPAPAPGQAPAPPPPTQTPRPGQDQGPSAPAATGPAPRPAPPRGQAAGPPPPTQPPRPVQAQGPAPEPPASTLDRSYQAERANLEARHRQEFAQPPAGESPAALSQRQEAEHQALDQRYQQARGSGKATMPPPQQGKAPPEKAPPKSREPNNREPNKQ